MINLEQYDNKSENFLNLLKFINEKYPSMSDFSLMNFFNYSTEQFEMVLKFLSKLNEMNLSNDVFNFLPSIFNTKQEDFENIFIFLDYIKKMNLSLLDAAQIFFNFNNREIIQNFSNKLKEEKNAKQRRRNSFTLFKKTIDGCYYAKYVCYNEQNQKYYIKKSTGKFDKLEASQWAEENKEEAIQQYINKKTNIKDLFSNFWKEEKTVFSLSKADIKKNDFYINNYVLPFLWNNQKRRKLTDINYTDIEKLRRYLLNDLKRNETTGLSPKTVNNILSILRKMFNYFVVDMGLITNEQNPMKDKFSIIKSNYKENERDGIPSRCFKNIFNNKWENEKNYTLCLIGFNTGMRNSEINRIHINDIILDNNYYFLNVRGEKTENAVRRIPITNFCYNKINEYYLKWGNKETGKVFNITSDKYYKFAIEELLKNIDEDLKELKITFYSLRHTYKTILASNGITKDIAEYLMGHSNKSGVDKTYIDYKTFDIYKQANKINLIFEGLF